MSSVVAAVFAIALQPTEVEVEGVAHGEPLSEAEIEASAPVSGRGAHWRFTWLVMTHTFVSGLDHPDNGLAIGAYFGVGLPIRTSQRLREEHGFGYAGELAYRGFATSSSQRHRIAATGLVGRRASLYYQVALGAAVYGLRFFDFAGPSMGGRIGIGLGRRKVYVFALGGDLDIAAGGPDRGDVAPSLMLSLLTFGAL